jgi:hypothetical protein
VPRDFIDRLIAYETGGLSPDQTVAFFQELIDSGQAWNLQGHYGRVAAALIEAGYCHEATVPDPKTGCIHQWGGDDTCYLCDAPRSP